jgi:ketosteroid isomerase-like protein
MSDRHPNAALLETFYSAFARLDAETMVSCYAPLAHFSDPVFQDLLGAEVFSMWRMLARRAKEFTLTYRDVVADDAAGRAHWEARYLFSKTGRRIHNVIEASFSFADGKIVSHKDDFDLWRWAGMALGAPGTLLGWTPILQRKIRREAMKGLEEFMEARDSRVPSQGTRSRGEGA